MSSTIESLEPMAMPALLELGSDFYDEVEPAKFPQKILRYENHKASELLGLAAKAQSFADFQALPQNLPQALALRYHGHQFQHYNPDLGDGRGFVYAQIKSRGKLYDLGTKGSGQTPWSRQGDGRLTLKGAVREALATEILHSLGVHTSQSFCFFETGESLQRNDEPSPARSAVLTRMSESHIRYGSFQRLASLGQKENFAKLLDYCVRHYDPGALCSSIETLAKDFFQHVVQKAASTTADWMMSGFVHGVLNTDNMNITGESFDYGPYRFLPTYDPLFTAAYFDRSGLYAYGRQPSAVMWNLQALAASFQVLQKLDLKDQLQSFPDLFSSQVLEKFLRRLNLKPISKEQDENLFSLFFKALQSSQAPFEQSFFDHFSGWALQKWQKSPQKNFYDSPDFRDFHQALQKFSLENESFSQQIYFQQDLACTLLIDEIESLWKKIELEDDWSIFHQKIDQIRKITSTSVVLSR